MKKELQIKSTNNKDMLHVIVWEPEVPIKGIVQISHGMIEYVDRFDGLARFLCDEGYLCIGNDHIGHGMTAASSDDLGYFGEGLSKSVVYDLYEVTKYAKEHYGKDVPYYLFGHSMGSFMARRYIETFGNELNGVILSGTGYTDEAILAAGKVVAGIVKAVKGERYRSKLLNNMAFGAYNSKIENARTTHDWLTKDEAIVDRYLQDPFCTYTFTVNGYQTLFDVLSYIQKKDNVAKIPRNLPILMVSGDADPVGDYGKGVTKVMQQFKQVGLADVHMILYEGDRHELTNELDKDKVFEDIKNWLSAH